MTVHLNSINGTILKLLFSPLNLLFKRNSLNPPYISFGAEYIFMNICSYFTI